MSPLLRPSILTLLLSVNFIVLLLPLGAVYGLRLFENELIRRTETNLVSQGGLLAASFKKEILLFVREKGFEATGNPLVPESPFRNINDYLLISPQLDAVKEKIYPPAPKGRLPRQPPNNSALMAGESLEPMLREAKRITLTGVRLVDSQGIVVASSGTEKYLSLSERIEVQQALTGKYVSLLRQRISDEPAPKLTSISRSSDFRIFAAMPVVYGEKVLGAVILSRSPLSTTKGLYLMRSQLLRAAAFIIVLVVLFTIVTTFLISAPIKALVKQADKVRQGKQDLAQPLKYPGTKEIAHLSNAIAKMAQSLGEREEYIKTFAGSVSHEFKTPLSSLKGSVELLQSYSNEMSKEEHGTFLSNMEKDVSRLDRLVGRLLELAKADVVSPGIATCEINGVFLSMVRLYRKRKNVEFVNSPQHLPIQMEQDILKSILSNLIENSLQHGGAKVKVTLVAKRSKDKAEIFVLDTGPGISLYNREKIFLQFFTTARHSGGSGLGLTIVRSLLSAHGGTIELLDKEKETTFKVSLPLLALDKS